jgi:molybdate transport system substrate-binding protein
VGAVDGRNAASGAEPAGAGAPHPDMSSVEGFKRALEQAQSIAYSDSASGAHCRADQRLRKIGLALAIDLARGAEIIQRLAYADDDIGGLAARVYIETVIYQKLGMSDAVKAKSKMIPADPVGEVVSRGQAELGFQQMSELKPVNGIDLLGPIPAEVQKVTTFTAAIASNAKAREAGVALIQFLAAPEAADTIRRSGMEPVKGE